MRLLARSAPRLLLGILACLSLFGRAAVGETVEPSRVLYSADGDGCPGPRDFDASVRERIRRGRLAEDGQPAREYRVQIRTVGSRFVARLEFTEPNGANRTREVGSETCADAATAIALVTALAIDAAGTEQSDDTGAAAEGTLTPSEALGLVPPETGAPAASAKPAVVPPPAAASEPASKEHPAAGVPLHLAAGVRGSITTSKGPQALPGVELFASLRADGTIPWLVDLGFAGERGAKERNGPGQTRFSFLGARLRGCAFAWQPLQSLDVRPCAVIETGAVVAEGFIDHPETRVDGWFAAGVAGRVTARIGPAAIAVEAGPIFPITRNGYVFGPTTGPNSFPVYDVGVVGVYASLGVALEIF
jgi:hypothetical protein